ncbi:MAG: hypothetical protein JNN15_09370, partial [Blastocatellia bacterium]|nr:hypothetical protein [Blastocatellia bacterium]
VWAKLALKALFIYSLSGKPVTLNKLADSVMIYDERDPFTAIQKMRAILGCFVSTTPKAIEVSGEGEELGCRFVIGAAKSPNQILEEMASEIDEEDPRLAELLICIGGEYFSDWPLKPDPYTQTLTQRAEIRIPWRGTLRKGILKIGDMVELLPIDPNIGTGIDEDLLAMGMDFESPQSVTESLENDEDDLPEIDVLFDSQTEAPAISAADLEEAPVKVCEWDWQISIVPINGSPPAVAPKYSPVTLFYWQPQRMNAEDARKLKQALVLRTESELFIKHGLNIQAFSDALNAELRMIFHRLYVEGGYLLCPAKQSAIQVSTPESLELEAETQDHLLEELFSELLIEGFANRFPLHPIFGDQLTEYEVLRLTVGLFGALNPSSPVVQSYAEAYGLPFKLVAKVDGEYRLSLDIDDPHPAVAEILQRITDSESGSIAIKDSYVTLRKEPYGLQLPAQRLIIMALIAAWKIELTDESASKSLSASQLSTESEFRHYTIIRKPSISHPPELITAWCGMLTAQEAEADLISPQGRRQVREALQNWRDNWVNLGLVSRIETLPADLLTTRLWQITVSCRRYFEAISSSIAGLLNDEFSVEASISKIIDIFNGKETIYIKAVNELTMLVQYLDWLPYYIETKNYVLAAEKTNDSQINNERRELVDFLSQSNRLLDEEKRQRYEMVYNSFHTRYVDYYCTLHDSMVASQGIKNQLEEIISSQKWRNFEILSQLSVANRSYYATAIDLVRSLRERMCVFPTRELLQTQPFCACSFRINQTVDPATKIEILKVVIDIGTAYHKRLLKHYAPQIKKIGENQNNGEHDARFDKLQKLISDTNGLDIVELSTIEAFNDLTLATPSSIGLFPVVRFGGKSSKDQLRKDFEKWFETLPDDPNLSLEFLDATEEKE